MKKKFEVTIRATVIKTLTVEAESDQEARNKAHEEFDVGETGPGIEENYKEEVDGCVEVKVATGPDMGPCPMCGSLQYSGFVRGWYGWNCGSNSQSQAPSPINFVRSVECAITEWQAKLQLEELKSKNLANALGVRNTIPDKVQAALDHVRSIYPGVTMVVFDAEGKWQFMGADFERVKFEGEFDPKSGTYSGIDVNILQDASDESYTTHGCPCVFQLQDEEIASA